MASVLAFWRREFGRTDPTRLGDLVVFPLAVSVTVGLISGVAAEITRRFLDPDFIGYSIAVDAGIQIVFLLLALALAFITRRRVWSAMLFSIGFFCFLAIPEFIRLVLPGVAHWLSVFIGLLAAFQIARAVNRHRHSQFALWMIGVPALVALCAFSFSQIREFSQLNALPKAPDSPNVLIIIVDALRADHLSPYGYTRDTSPYLTQLAQQGVLFENAISPASWTLPSHASMLTGLYPHETKVETEKDVISGNLPILGDAMRKRGYRTAGFSANYFMFSRSRGFGQGVSHFEDYQQTLAGILEEVPLSKFIFGKLSHYTTGEPDAFFGVKNYAKAGTINDDVVNWIIKGRRPFFVVLNYFDVHEPVIPPDPYMHMYARNSQALDRSKYLQGNCDFEKVLCNSEVPQFVDKYDGATRYVDDNVQHLLSRLNELGLLKDTIVVFTSDHGEEIGDHGIFGHGKSLYRPEIHVPLVFWKPGMVPASVRVPAPVSTTDIPATILDLIAAGNQPSLPGHSLAPLWNTSQPVSDGHEPLSELARLHWFDKNAPNYNFPVLTIVTPEWHYIRQQDKDLLFDWKTDPDETRDQCAAQPTVCAALRTRAQTAAASQPQAH
jgi:arylsulfatase A-like enzyme